MNIIMKSSELTVMEQYQLTKSPKIQRMREAEGQRLEVCKWCVYEDTDSRGEVKEILSIMTPEGEVFATNSDTFKRDFKDITDMLHEAGMDGTVFTIEVITGTSKAGRTFYTCAYTE